MNVQFITITSSSARRTTFRADHDDLREAIIEFLEDGTRQRIAFGGKTSLGRSGIVLQCGELLPVSGHKIDPIPEELLDLVEHHTDYLLGLEEFSRGHDVLIGTKNHGVVLKWAGRGFEVFGAGRDSEAHDPSLHS